MGQQGNSSKILKFKFMFFNDLKKAEYVLKFPWYGGSMLHWSSDGKVEGLWRNTVF